MLFISESFTLSLLLLLFVAARSDAAAGPKMVSASFTITKTWDDRPIDKKDYVHIELLYSENLSIKVSAPFYDDPHLPDMTHNPGSFDKLYDFEVVEVFLLGEDDRYLEVELGPKGQYLVLELHGYRNVTRYPIDLLNYQSKVSGHIWAGVGVVPHSILPPKISHMNAYAIHGTNETRQYQSLYPAPHNSPNFTAPDFHKLELFKPISLFNGKD